MVEDIIEKRRREKLEIAARVYGAEVGRIASRKPTRVGLDDVPAFIKDYEINKVSDVEREKCVAIATRAAIDAFEARR